MYLYSGRPVWSFDVADMQNPESSTSSAQSMADFAAKTAQEKLLAKEQEAQLLLAADLSPEEEVIQARIAAQNALIRRGEVTDENGKPLMFSKVGISDETGTEVPSGDTSTSTMQETKRIVFVSRTNEMKLETAIIAYSENDGWRMVRGTREEFVALERKEVVWAIHYLRNNNWFLCTNMYMSTVSQIKASVKSSLLSRTRIVFPITNRTPQTPRGIPHGLDAIHDNNALPACVFHESTFQQPARFIVARLTEMIVVTFGLTDSTQVDVSSKRMLDFQPTMLRVSPNGCYLWLLSANGNVAIRSIDAERDAMSDVYLRITKDGNGKDEQVKFKATAACTANQTKNDFPVLFLTDGNQVVRAVFCMKKGINSLVFTPIDDPEKTMSQEAGGSQPPSGLDRVLASERAYGTFLDLKNGTMLVVEGAYARVLKYEHMHSDKDRNEFPIAILQPSQLKILPNPSTESTSQHRQHTGYQSLYNSVQLEIGGSSSASEWHALLTRDGTLCMFAVEFMYGRPDGQECPRRKETTSIQVENLDGFDLATLDSFYVNVIIESKTEYMDCTNHNGCWHRASFSTCDKPGDRDDALIVHVNRENHKDALGLIQGKLERLPDGVAKLRLCTSGKWRRDVVFAEPGSACLATAVSVTEIVLKHEALQAHAKSEVAIANHYRPREALYALAATTRSAAAAMLAAFFPVEKLDKFLIRSEDAESLSKESTNATNLGHGQNLSDWEKSIHHNASPSSKPSNDETQKGSGSAEGAEHPRPQKTIHVSESVVDYANWMVRSVSLDSSLFDMVTTMVASFQQLETDTWIEQPIVFHDQLGHSITYSLQITEQERQEVDCWQNPLGGMLPRLVVKLVLGQRIFRDGIFEVVADLGNDRFVQNMIVRLVEIARHLCVTSQWFERTKCFQHPVVYVGTHPSA